MRRSGTCSRFAHAPYTLNACAADEGLRTFARETMADDLARLEPGSHVRQGVEAGVERIAEHLNAILRPEQSTTVLLETMAGKGSEVGGSFAELRAILDRVRLPEKLGVCLDTCHVHDAGYDICGDLDGVLEEFDRVVGLERLRAVHLNDSKNPLGSRKDRHEKLGLGTIGLEALALLPGDAQRPGRLCAGDRLRQGPGRGGEEKINHFFENILTMERRCLIMCL